MILYALAKLNPLAAAEDPQITRAVLIDSAPGPLRVGAENLASIPCAASLHPSRIVHAYLLCNSRRKYPTLAS